MTVSQSDCNLLDKVKYLVQIVLPGPKKCKNAACNGITRSYVA